MHILTDTYIRIHSHEEKHARKHTDTHPIKTIVCGH